MSFPSFGSGLTGPAYPLYPDVLPYTWNLAQGARRWRDAVGRVRDGRYGVDVLVIGDSTSTYGDWFSSWPHRLKVLLQEQFNDPNVPGGFGFMPFGTGAYTNLWSYAGAGWVDSSPNYTYNNVGRPATAMIEAATHVATAGNKIWRTFDGTSTAAKWQRQYVTDWEYVGLSYTGGVTANRAYCDSSTGVGPLTSSNLVTGPGSNAWGEHWPRQTGLTRTAANTIQVSSTSSDQLWANGVITYDGDYNEGVRLHNLSQPGCATDIMNHDGQVLQANIDQFSTGQNGGARNAKLVLVNTMLNDCGPTTSNLPVSTYKANLQAMITQAISQPSHPCVGLIVSQPWSSTTATPGQLAAYPAYRDACYQLAAANDHVFIVDFWRVLDDTTHPQYAPHGTNTSGGAIHDRGWYNDGTHLLDVGNFARARMLYAILTYGV